MMNNVVIAIYLAKLFAAVFAVMGVGCVFERPGASGKSTLGKSIFAGGK